MKPVIKIIIGLGNPDEQYHNTYHNIGHLFIDFLLKFEIRNLAYRQAGSKFEILKSPSYMNQSGQFVKEELKEHRLKPENLLIIHDDSDIELGQAKLSFNRGSGGHKGVQDIIDQLGSKNFWRLRVGIRPALKTPLTTARRLHRPKAEDLVLKKISSAHNKIFQNLFKAEIEKIFPPSS